MTGSEAITAICTATAHDTDTQTTTTQLYAQLGIEYQRLRRWLCVVAPELCKQQLTATLLSGQSTVLKSLMVPAFEQLWLVERLVTGTTYAEVAVVGQNPLVTGLTVEEFPTLLRFSPAESAPGTYRITYLSGVSATVAAGTTFDLPGGLEDVLVQRCAAFMRSRHNDGMDKAKWHKDLADELIKEQKPLLMRRYGIMPVPGLKRTRY